MTSMNDKLQDILAETLEKAQVVGGELYDATKSGLGNAVDFAKEQIPDVIAQLMMWEFAYHAMWASVWVLFIITLISLGVFAWKKSNKFDKDDTDYGGAAGYYGFKATIFVAILISFITLCNGVMDNVTACAKVKFAPKIFLLEYCAELIEVRKHNANEKTVYYRTHTHSH